MQGESIAYLTRMILVHCNSPGQGLFNLHSTQKPRRSIKVARVLERA